jgi:hypothetical protein
MLRTRRALPPNLDLRCRDHERLVGPGPLKRIARIYFDVMVGIIRPFSS